MLKSLADALHRLRFLPCLKSKQLRILVQHIYFVLLSNHEMEEIFNYSLSLAFKNIIKIYTNWAMAAKAATT